jgi:hypothetical protein
VRSPACGERRHAAIVTAKALKPKRNRKSPVPRHGMA